MIVTNGVKVFNTDCMIEIEQRENFSSCSVSEKILFSELDEKYYYFSQKNYNIPNHIVFRSTSANSLIELDEAEENEYFIDDYLADFEWSEVISYSEIMDNIIGNLEDEFDEEQYDFSQLYTIAQQHDDEKNIDKESFLNSVNQVLTQNQIDSLNNIDDLDNVVKSICALKCDLLFDNNEFEKRTIFEIRVAEEGFYLFHKLEYEPMLYTFVNELPVDFILKHCYSKQRFEDLIYLLKYIPQNYRDESIEDRKYNFLYDNEMATIWGVTRQNFSKTYSNPIKSQKRLRKRQKMIIELGCTALKYGLNEKQILDFAKSLKM